MTEAALASAIPNSASAERLLMSVRWPDGVRCPRCGEADIDIRRRHAPRRWRCRTCRYDFSVATGTSMHGSKIEVSKWISAAFVEDARPAALARALGVSSPTARRIAQVLSLTEEPPGECRLRALLRLGPSPVQAHNDSIPVTIRPSGDVSVTRMTAGQLAVMVALRSRLRGCTVAGVAQSAGLSERHTRRCLRALEERRLATSEDASVPWGYGSLRIRLWSLARTAECWTALAYLPLRHETFERECPERVPPRFWYLFWSGSQGGDLRLPRDAHFVACALVDSPDTAAQAWSLRHLPTQALRECRAMRGYDTGRIAAMLDVAIAARSVRASSNNWDG